MLKKVYVIIKVLIILMVASLSIYATNIIYHLGIIPNKYMYIMIVLLGLFNILGGILLFRRKWYLKMIGSLIYIAILVISFIGIKYGMETEKFLDHSFSTHKKEVATFYVLVKNDSNYHNLSDLNGKEISYFSFYDDVELIKKEINKNITNVELIEQNDLYDTFIDFLDGEITSIVIDEGYLDVLREDYDDLDTKVRKLYTFEIETKVEVIVENKLDKISIPTESINIYISGSDSRNAIISAKSRSDVNMIVTINPKTKTILLTSIPRDYYVQMNGTTGLKDKLTHTGIYGLNASKTTLEDLFGTNINYSIKTGFSAVVNVVDLVGGIEVYSDREFYATHMRSWRVNKGINYMDGKKALVYARERFAYASGDRHRILNQQQVLQATLEKILADKTILLKYEKVLEAFSQFYITDIPREVISAYIKMQLDDMSSWKFISQSVDGSGATLATYSAPNSRAYVMIPNQALVQKASSKIKEVLEETNINNEL